MEKLNQMRKRALLGTLAGIITTIIGFLSFLKNPFLGMTLFIGGAVVIIIVSCTASNSFRKAYKETICREVLEKMFDVKEYKPDEGFSEDFVNSTYLIPSGNRFSSDDYISGSYQGFDFIHSDVVMEEHTSDGKDSSTTTLFEGSWTVFTFPKKISSYLMIREREFLSNGRPGGLFSNAPRTQKVTFEDVDFNDHFDVYAEDEHDAFYICTPHFIERIKQLEASFDGRMTIGLIDSKLHVLFDNHENAMEPSLWKEVTKEDYRLIEDEMHKIIEIIDLLNLIPENGR